MYTEYYNLTEYPFNITADPNFFYASARHADAYANVEYGIRQRKGIMVITGEIGTGKTTLIRTVMAYMEANVKTAMVLNPNFSDTQLLQIILADLGIRNKSTDKFELVNWLNEYLIEETQAGNNVVIIIDEAQNLSVEQLENIRLLSNLETTKEKLLQIILVGQPELNDKLRLHELRQLNQRVSVRFHVVPLSKQETTEYILRRLEIASIDNKPKVTITDAGYDAIFRHTRGTPRMINVLCDRALLAGFVAGIKVLDKDLIDQCAEEVFSYEYN